MKITGETITPAQIGEVRARWAVDIGGCAHTVRSCDRALRGCWLSLWAVADVYNDMQALAAEEAA